MSTWNVLEFGCTCNYIPNIMAKYMELLGIMDVLQTRVRATLLQSI